jgi:hypothetical protein
VKNNMSYSPANLAARAEIQDVMYRWCRAVDRCDWEAIRVVREAGKLPYLRTYADGKWNDNLLAQRECDGTCRLVA